MLKPGTPTLHQQNDRPVQWIAVVAIIAVILASYSALSPAAATYRNGFDERRDKAIQEIIDHQKWQDARHDRLEKKVDDQSVLLNNIDKQTTIIAKNSEWMAAWIKSGGQK